MILPLSQAAIFRDAAALRRALLLGKEAVRAPDAICFCRGPSGVLVSVGRAQCAVFGPTTFSSLPISSLRTLLNSFTAEPYSWQLCGGENVF